jgi:hypothetical protein
MKHLALAVLYEPSNVLARGLLGLVAYKGKWAQPDVVGRELRDDPAQKELIREYLDRRAKTAHQVDAQSRLAAWCDEVGLKEQAIAHYTEAIRLNPLREAAWRHLGYKKQGDRWIKPEEVAAERLESERQKHADKQWRPKLERMRDGLESKEAARRSKAEAALVEVTDPRAVPMIWAVLVRRSERARLAAVQMLGQIDGPAASSALAALAIFNPSGEVRGRATETLMRRDPRDVVGKLIRLVRKPFKYEVRNPDGPGTTGVLFVEGERFNVQRLYQQPPIDPWLFPRRIFSPDMPFDPFNGRNLVLATAAYAGASFVTSGPAVAAAPSGAVISGPGPHVARSSGGPHGAAAGALGSASAGMMVYNVLADAVFREVQIAAAYQMIQQATQDLQQRLALDIQIVETTNAQINQVNGRVLPALRTMTGQDIEVEPEKWKAWWTDQLGYAYRSSIPETKPTFTDTVSVVTPFSVGMRGGGSCFSAGTPVATVDGPCPIESIQVGDRVLSQDTTTGLLSFQPVVAIHRNQPAPTYRITADGETIRATGIHRFWKAGKGWTMARDLKAGDLLRTIGGTALVRAIETDAVVPVFKLDVAQNRDFFVGTRGLLVHDFTFVQPVLAPFDRYEPVSR